MTAPPPAVSPGRSTVEDAFSTLETMHDWRGWHWTPSTDPFEICVGSILVQNTAWANVERALDALRTADRMAPATMDALTQPELELLVRPSGQFRQKARKLRAFLDLVRGHGSLDALLALSAESLRSRLLATWGIGPETADAIVLYAARKPAFVVDAYTIRIFGRLRLGPPAAAGYHAWQRFFTTLLPADVEDWARMHALIVLHAKHHCIKHRPRCDACLLAPRCGGPQA